MKFSEKLLTLRKQHGLSQDDLAIKLDISRQAVYKWENEQSKPELDKLKILSDLFNVSIDNLLDDNADISLRPLNNKKSYSEVIVLDTPKALMAETVNTNYTDEEKKKIKIRESMIKYGFIGMLVAVAMLLIAFILPISGPQTELGLTIFSILLPVGFIVFAIAGLTYYIGKKFVYKNCYETRTYFYNEKSNGETHLKQKGYEYVMLQHDLPVWFFYDLVNDDKFGIYFNGKEQFVCPIQNYVTLTSENLPNSLKVSFTYFDVNGEIKEYAFLLSFVREYVSKILEDSTDLSFALDGLEKETIQAISEIKKRIDAKKETSKIA